MSGKLTRLAAAAVTLTATIVASTWFYQRTPQKPPPTVIEQLSSGDKRSQQQAIDAIRETANAHPAMAAQNIETLVGALSAQKKFDEIESLCLKTIVGAPQDTPKVIEAQRSRVDAALSAGKFDAALALAKSYYNVASLADNAQATALLEAALSKARSDSDPDVVARFRREQIAGAYTSGVESPSVSTRPAAGGVLASVQVNAAPYAAAIERTSGSASRDVIARGNLLLLADRPAEARECFASALRTGPLTKKEIYALVDALGRATRDEFGQIGPANAVVLSLKLGTPNRLAKEVLGPSPLNVGEVQTACEGNALAELPSEYSAAKADTASNTTDDALTGPANPTTHPNTGQAIPGPLTVARATPVENSKLNAWLDRWRSGGEETVSETDRSGLSDVIAHDDLPSITLFWLGYSFHVASHDAATSVLFYHAAAKRAHEEFSRQLPPPVVKTVVQAMNSTMSDYKRVLWPMIESDDKTALTTLHAIYRDYAQFCPANERKLAKALTHVRIGLSECLYLEKDYAGAYELLQHLDPSQMTQGERGAYSWARGLLLYSTYRYADSIADLQYVANLDSHPYKADARAMSVLALTYGKRLSEAEGEYQRLAASGEQTRLLRQCRETLDTALEYARKQTNERSVSPSPLQN